jgi:Cu-Zn family superoxide dismutase
MKKLLAGISVVLTLGSAGLMAQETTMSATMNKVTATGTAESIGTVTFRQGEHGLIIEPNLAGLTPGPVGAHIHQNADCGPGPDGTPAGAAGTHIDPNTTGKHEGPYGQGHLGDTPNLVVEQDGTVKLPVLAPRVKLSDLAGKSFMIHAAKDNYSDQPGGSRAYCGIIK